MRLPASPATTSRLIAVGRIAIGLVAYARPQVGAAAFRSRTLPVEAIGGWRLAGARDLALGLGVVMAGRRDRGRVRGWTEAGALADAMDVLSFATDPGLRTSARVGGALVAAGAAAAGFAAAAGMDR